MSQQNLMIPLLCFTSVAMCTFTALTVCQPYWRRVRQRLAQLDATGRSAPDIAPKPKGQRATSSLNVWLMQHPWFVSLANNANLRMRLVKAGIYNPAAVSAYYATQVVAALGTALATIGGGLLFQIPFEGVIVIGIIMGILGALLPSVILDRAIARRRLRMRHALPDFLDLMTVCLDGGLSLQETILRVSIELQLAHPALASELTIVRRDMELGATVEQALRRCALRADCDELRTLSTFLREAQRFGTKITDALRDFADALRNQREQAAEENAQKVAVKILIPTLLLIFPAIFVVSVGPALLQIQEAFAAK
jgi:tight adherence protein C